MRGDHHYHRSDDNDSHDVAPYHDNDRGAYNDHPAAGHYDHGTAERLCGGSGSSRGKPGDSRC
jgi:hypothetical protein